MIRAWPGLAGQTIRIVVANSARDHQTLTWTVPGVSAKPAGPAGPALTSIMASAAAWLSLLENRTNVVTELTTGRLRSSTAAISTASAPMRCTPSPGCSDWPGPR